MTSPPRAQYFRHTPGLRKCAACHEWRFAIEDLANAAEPGCQKMVGHWLEKRKGPPRVVVNAQVGQDKRAEQPGPHCSLVVSGVALRLRALVIAAVVRIGRIQTSQSMRRRQAQRANIYHAFLLLRIQWTFRKRDSENVIGPHRTVVSVRAVDYVKTALTFLIPVAREGFFHAPGKPRVLVCRFP